MLELDFPSSITIQNLLLIATSIAIVVMTIVADKIIRSLISKYSKRVELEKHAENVFRLIARVIIFASGTVALLQNLGLGVEWFLGVSAFTGAAIGFASTQTVGNFLAGLYLMVSRPFMVKDYVKIGDVEGEVTEITLNYTKIFTPTYNLTEIPNRKVLDSIITNFSTKKNVIDYSMKLEFPHSDVITNEEILRECIDHEIENFYEKYKEFLPKKPESSMSCMTRLGRSFMIRIFYPEGNVKYFYDIQPELTKNIVDRWDEYKNKKSIK